MRALRLTLGYIAVFTLLLGAVYFAGHTVGVGNVTTHGYDPSPLWALTLAVLVAVTGYLIAIRHTTLAAFALLTTITLTGLTLSTYLPDGCVLGDPSADWRALTQFTAPLIGVVIAVTYWAVFFRRWNRAVVITLAALLAVPSLILAVTAGISTVQGSSSHSCGAYATPTSAAVTR